MCLDIILEKLGGGIAEAIKPMFSMPEENDLERGAEHLVTWPK
jgi:hypothetical protein